MLHKACNWHVTESWYSPLQPTRWAYRQTTESRIGLARRRNTENVYLYIIRKIFTIQDSGLKAKGKKTKKAKWQPGDHGAKRDERPWLPRPLSRAPFSRVAGTPLLAPAAPASHLIYIEVSLPIAESGDIWSRGDRNAKYLYIQKNICQKDRCLRRLLLPLSAYSQKQVIL